MSNPIKSVFSIKDLENLSGIKAHTIRMWEKRYGVLLPMRHETNVRYYDLASLQKLLNITLLHRHGYKISKIGSFPPQELNGLVRQIISEKSVKSHAINAFKMAMMGFDQPLFFKTYDKLLSKKNFQEVFHEVFVPLLEEIGLLWQTATITPAHEHFISYLVRQKILTNLELIQSAEPTREDKVFVLFLPQNELHDLGLMYLHYEITLNGYRSIFLGESIPVDGLRELKKLFANITYVSYFTVEPARQAIAEYVDYFEKEVLEENSEFWILGALSKNIASRDRIRQFDGIRAAIMEL